MSLNTSQNYVQEVELATPSVPPSAASGAAPPAVPVAGEQVTVSPIRKRPRVEGPGGCQLENLWKPRVALVKYNYPVG